MFRKILIGLDGSKASQHAVRRALELANLAHAEEVCALSVHQGLRAYAGTGSEIESDVACQAARSMKLLADAERMAGAMGVQLTTEILTGHAGELIARRAQEGGFDLVVVGHPGHSWLHHRFLGSTTDRVVEEADCAVLVVRSRTGLKLVQDGAI
jgi:nucleotide-binding universal stress UspA family protein